MYVWGEHGRVWTAKDGDAPATVSEACLLSLYALFSACLNCGPEERHESRLNGKGEREVAVTE